MTESTPARSPTGGSRPLLHSLRAPAHWHQIDFISDLHLHAGDASTFAAWQHYLQHTTAQAVFMLGDLFEAWVGDDVLSPPDTQAGTDNRFELACARVLHRAGARLDLFFICGNRDFLVGPQALQACAMQGLDDPCVLALGTHRWLLSHGDALCLDDSAYQQFRAQVRSPAWQNAFLARPLAERQSVARELRARSEQYKRAQPALVDVDGRAAQQWLHDAGADVLIHGHTHQPADHRLTDTLRRTVLSDWDLQATPARAEVLRVWLSPSGDPMHCRRLAPAQAC